MNDAAVGDAVKRRSATAAEQQRVADLLADYADCLDNDGLEQWPDFFHEDAVYKVVSRENESLGLPAPIIYHYSRGMLQDRVTAIRDALTFEPVYTRHLISAPRVHVEADRLHAVSSYAVYQTTEEGRTRLYSVGRYVDVLADDAGGALRFKSRVVVADTFAIYNLMALPL